MEDFVRKEVADAFGEIAFHINEIAVLKGKIEEFQKNCKHPLESWKKCENQGRNGSSIGFPVQCQKCLAVIEVNKTRFCSECLSEMRPDFEKSDDNKPKIVVGYVCSACGKRHIGAV